MDLQTITTTQAQRNFGKLLDNLNEPVVVMRDSRPEAVVLDYDDYVRMKKFEEDRVEKEFEEALDRMQLQNKKVDEKKLDKLIKEALHASGRD